MIRTRIFLFTVSTFHPSQTRKGGVLWTKYGGEPITDNTHPHLTQQTNVSVWLGSKKWNANLSSIQQGRLGTPNSMG